MIRWGINALNHGSSLAVFNNERLISLDVSHEDEIPNDIKLKALNYGGAPDRIHWYERPWVKKARQVYAGQYNTAMDMSNLPSNYTRKAGLGYAPITYTPHHASHAAAGYYTSPFNHCAIVVLDAIGEFECATIWEGKHGELKKVWSRSYPHSLGLFYSAFTQLTGLTPIKDEHLLQKMAEQGDPKRYFNLVNNYISNTIKLKYNLHRGVYNWPDPINNLQDQCDIAAAVQDAFEGQIGMVMMQAKKLINTDCLVYMGGCAMNSAANKRFVEPMFRYRWSLPNPGDPNSSIGAVLYHTKDRVRDYPWDTVKHIEIKT
jgi:carbamoyltransferase